ncbi:MAG: hypothetical protein ACT4OO_11860 [Nitrospiraceae bacterium]
MNKASFVFKTAVLIELCNFMSQIILSVQDVQSFLTESGLSIPAPMNHSFHTLLLCRFSPTEAEPVAAASGPWDQDRPARGPGSEKETVMGASAQVREWDSG